MINFIYIIEYLVGVNIRKIKKNRTNNSLNSSLRISEKLIESGAFGENPKILLSLKDKLRHTEFCYKGFLSIYEEPEKIYGVKNTIGLTYTFLEIIAASQVINGSQIPIDILTSTWNGTDDNPNLECFSSYLDFICAHKTLNKNTEISQLEKYNYSVLVLTVYTKGVELINKFFTFIITILEVTGQIKDSLNKNNKLTLYEKINRFLELSDGKYDKLVNIVNRKIRNAYSHSSVTPHFENNEYIFKNDREEFAVPFEEMLYNIYPQISWFIQAFIGSGLLLILLNTDIILYKKSINHINELNERSDII